MDKISDGNERMWQRERQVLVDAVEAQKAEIGTLRSRIADMTKDAWPGPLGLAMLVFATAAIIFATGMHVGARVEQGLSVRFDAAHQFGEPITNMTGDLANKPLTKTGTISLADTDIIQGTYTADEISAAQVRHCCPETHAKDGTRISPVDGIGVHGCGSTNTLTLSPIYGTIDGASTKVVVNTARGAWLGYCDGTNWHTIGTCSVTRNIESGTGISGGGVHRFPNGTTNIIPVSSEITIDAGGHITSVSERSVRSSKR